MQEARAAAAHASGLLRSENPRFCVEVDAAAQFSPTSINFVIFARTAAANVPNGRTGEQGFDGAPAVLKRADQIDDCKEPIRK